MSSLLESPPSGLQVIKGRQIPDAWEYDWAVSTGRRADEFMKETQDLEDTLLEYKGVQAMGSANHFQFVGYREVLMQGLPESWDQRLMGDMVEFDRRLDQLGYLRLSTPGRFVRHIGNTINEELSQEAELLGLDLQAS